MWVRIYSYKRENLVYYRFVRVLNIWTRFVLTLLTVVHT